MKKDETLVMRKLYRSLFPVQALAVGLPAINTLLNSFIVGHFLGENALAAIGFVGPLTMLISAVSVAISSGSVLLCGRFLGRGDREGIHSTFTAMSVLVVLFGAVLSALMMLCPDAIATVLGASGPSRDLTVIYIRGLGIGTMFSIASTSLLALSQLERMGKLATVVAVTMLVVNVGGNLLNVFVLNWGIFGVSFFLSVAYIVAVLIALPIILTRSEIFSFSLKWFRWKTALDIFKNGSPYAVNSLSVSVRSYFVNHFIYLLGGTTAMAAVSIADNLSCAVGCVLEAGYNGAASTIAGVLVGQRDVSSLRDLPKVMFRSAWYILIPGYLIVFLIARPAALFLGADVSHISLFVTTIRLYDFWIVTTLFFIPPRAIYQAMGKIKLCNIITVIYSDVGPILTLYLFAKTAGINLVVSMSWIAELYCILLYAVYFVYKAKRLPRSPLELCYIPSSFGVQRENRLKAVIYTTEDAVEASKKTVDFCRENGMSAKLAYYCGLCVEEIAADAVLNRFGSKNTALDLRVVYEDGKVSILFRDDCPRFDPNEWLALCKPSEASRSIGIKMVSKLSDEMNYVSTIGLNVLLLTVSDHGAE